MILQIRLCKLHLTAILHDHLRKWNVFACCAYMLLKRYRIAFMNLYYEFVSRLMEEQCSVWLWIFAVFANVVFEEFVFCCLMVWSLQQQNCGFGMVAYLFPARIQNLIKAKVYVYNDILFCVCFYVCLEEQFKSVFYFTKIKIWENCNLQNNILCFVFQGKCIPAKICWCWFKR